MNVSILSIGTELTTGQIINKNSTWMATRLKKDGIESRIHLTVPDDRLLILQALNFCAQQSEVLFVTGGLGPTSDDFTREVIAEWLQLKLVFHEESWVHIQTLLTQRGVAVQDIQKQQCYFPEKATVLKNTQGTANGFLVTTPQLEIFVLPGPPLELEALWQDHIQTWLQRKTLHLDKMITHSWDTLGQPESEVATTTENALAEVKKDFPLTVGYRAHLPYIEVKLSYPQSVDFTAKVFVQKVAKALEPITVLRNFEKASELFTQMIFTTPFAFYDFCTQGFLHQALAPHLKNHTDWMWKQSPEIMDSDFFADEKNFLALWSEDEKTCAIMANFRGKNFSQRIEIPARFLSRSERKLQYFTEMALIEFLRFYKKL